MPVAIDKTAWGGWPNCYRISNGEVELILTSDVGPRIMRYAYIGGPNLFLERDGELGGNSEPAFQLRGGHRLWHAPEHSVRTYCPDNHPIEVELQGATLTATAPPEIATGIGKSLLIRMAPVGSAVTVVHTLRNTLPWAIELAPWALSMMALGGVALVGFPAKGAYADNLAPANPFVMWAYTDLADSRLTLTTKHVLFRHDPAKPEPNKFGLFNPKTWGAYLLDGQLFLKRYEADPARTYPDFGCSFEAYVDGSILELETLGPLTRLEPGASIDHVERWTLTRNIAIHNWTDDEISRVLDPLL